MLAQFTINKNRVVAKLMPFLIIVINPFTTVVHQVAQWQQRDPAAVQSQPDSHRCAPGETG